MICVYDSLTGNVRRFVSRLEVESIRISPELKIIKPFFLITYTIGFGDIPKTTREFLTHNHPYLIGVAVSGNRNWGDKFAQAADTISKLYNVPIVHKFELSGTKKDVEIFLQEAQRIVESNSKLDQS
jgi:protein involved in ribonucleotide reduction